MFMNSLAACLAVFATTANTIPKGETANYVNCSITMTSLRTYLTLKLAYLATAISVVLWTTVYAIREPILLAETNLVAVGAKQTWRVVVVIAAKMDIGILILKILMDVKLAHATLWAPSTIEAVTRSPASVPVSVSSLLVTVISAFWITGACRRIRTVASLATVILVARTRIPATL